MAPPHPALECRLPKDWAVSTVDEIKSPEKHSCVAGPFGSSISSKYFTESGVPVIRGGNLTGGTSGFVDDGFVFVSPEQAEQYKAQTVVPDDLVFTCWGTIGQVGIIPRTAKFPKYVISNKQLKLRVDPTRMIPRFAYFHFSSPFMVKHIQNRAIGAAVPGINLGILKALPVVVPPLETQRRIAGILSAYDDLIEVNQRRIAILEEMARRLFEEWFVHFRYPGSEDVDQGLPDPWETGALSTLCAYINRGIAPAYVDEGGTPVINQKCIRNKRLDLNLARFQSKSPPADKLIQCGDVLINSTGVGTLGRVAQVFEVPEGATVDTHVTIARPAPGVDHTFFGALLLSLESDFERMGEGSTGQTELGRARIGGQTVLVPPTDLMARYGQIVTPMRSLSHTLQRANARLRAARDLLLPKLISGEIDVSAAPAPNDVARDAA